MSMAYAHPAPRSVRLGLRARLRARREARMASVAARGRLAEQLERAIERADSSRGACGAAVPVSRDAVHEALGALLDLGERLRAPRAVDPAGVRLVRELLVDGGSPLYVHRRPGELRAAATQALGTLDGHGPRTR